MGIIKKYEVYFNIPIKYKKSKVKINLDYQRKHFYGF